MLPATPVPVQEPTQKRLRIDFLYLDLATCVRCREAERNLASAVERLAATGAQRSCCAPEDKAACCGGDRCGCR